MAGSAVGDALSQKIIHPLLGGTLSRAKGENGAVRRRTRILRGYEHLLVTLSP